MALRPISIDIECVATGRGHDDRSIATIAVVDESGRLVLQLVVQPHLPIVSYLTPLTGLTAERLRGGIPEAEAVARVQALLAPNVLLVGQNPQSDASWLRLQQGVHYHSMLDLADVFAQFNPKYQNTSRYSLHHVMRVVLGVETQGEHHTAEQDALLSMQLYREYVGPANQSRLADAKKKLLYARNTGTNIAKNLGYVCDGVCMAAFRPDICRCGQPTKSSSE
eukprot:m.170362 g.170362  ORF g.170362 m.170362 type:complete len:223 (+) comp15276_c3_seq7:1192-1860(+)